MGNNVIYIGAALSVKDIFDDPYMKLPQNFREYLDIYKQFLGYGDNMLFEIQTGGPYVVRVGDRFERNDEKNKWLWIPNYDKIRRDDFRERFEYINRELTKGDKMIGVHQPARTIDILTNYPDYYEFSLRNVEESMMFAHMIGADYFVIHMTQKDYFFMNRKKQFQKAIEYMKRLADWYHNNGFSFVPCIENLEYPKIPATGYEMQRCHDVVKSFWPAIEFCLDYPHLWHSKFIIKDHIGNMARNGHKIDEFDEFREICTSDFIQYLNGMRQFDAIPDKIHVYHLAGCYEHETHGIPGLNPWENPFDNIMRLDKGSKYFRSKEMDVSSVLDTTIEFAREGDNPLRMILEIHGILNSQFQRAVSDIRKTVKAKMRRMT